MVAVVVVVPLAWRFSEVLLLVRLVRVRRRHCNHSRRFAAALISASSGGTKLNLGDKADGQRAPVHHCPVWVDFAPSPTQSDVDCF
ncbi:hypothetical protein GE21DRAFT_1287977 [Neurospora crassa]|nr:hypothetical protein GE21DRAFT_1287977 [Neurospora crassa]